MKRVRLASDEDGIGNDKGVKDDNTGIQGQDGVGNEGDSNDNTGINGKDGEGDQDQGEMEQENWSKTVFISNIPFQVTEPQLFQFLRHHFGSTGVRNVELKRDAQGHSKGLALAYFQDETLATTALHHDRLPLAGRPLFFSPYQPVPSTHRQSIISRDRNPRLLFISHLPERVTRTEIINHFPGNSQVRVIPHKHIAYVEYGSEEEAERMREIKDKSQLNGVSIRVQISDSKGARAQKTLVRMVPRSVGGTSRVGARPKLRLHLDSTTMAVDSTRENDDKDDDIANQLREKHLPI